MTAALEPAEAALLHSLTGQVIALLSDRHTDLAADDPTVAPDPLMAQLVIGGPFHPPEDPVLQRLLPDAYRDAPEDAEEFRRFTERSLAEAKVRHARVVLDSLQAAGFDPDDMADDRPVEVDLTAESVTSWLRALTDVRLAVAVRLGIETDDDTDRLALDDDEGVQAMLDIYDWLGYLQDSLVAALD